MKYLIKSKQINALFSKDKRAKCSWNQGVENSFMHDHLLGTETGNGGGAV